MPHRISYFVLPAALIACISVIRPDTSVATAAPPDSFEKDYAQKVRPLLTKYCQECHSAKQAEADIDLEKFATLTDVRKATKVWQKVGEMLDGGQMPPKDSIQPSDDERTTLRTWVRSHLKTEAKAHAGDPGRVTLRRLSNAEYTYTLRDLTGVASLNPANEFPVDGAAGEGFTNTGDALVMSPALLTKYLDAAKGVAAHAVLLPDGIGFSSRTSRQDWTNELLDQIRAVYGKYSDVSTRGARLNLQGEVFDSKEGGRLPVEKYVAATLIEREAIQTGRKTCTTVATERGLSAKYLEAVWRVLTDREPSPLLDDLRSRWKSAKPEEAAVITTEIARWQSALWKFNSIGHIGKLNGPKSWLEPVDRLVPKQDVRWKVPATDAAELSFSLVTSDCGDGNEHDFVVWQQPKFVAPGRPELLLKDVRAVSQQRIAHRTRVLSDTRKYLIAADEAITANGQADVLALAKKHGVEVDALRGWLDVLGIGTNGPVTVTGHFKEKQQSLSGHTFVTGWGNPDLPSIVANSSEKLVRIPGDLKGHGVAVHPSPTLSAVVGWQSKFTGKVRIDVKVQHVHTACGNGITWAIEVRRGTTRQRLASGVAQGQKPPKIDTLEDVAVTTGDVVSVIVGPRDGNHSCDLTAVDLTVSGEGKTWDLAKDVSGDLHSGNPHADGYKNAGVWHFYSEPTGGMSPALVIPKNSLLEQWRAAGANRGMLSVEVQNWLISPTTKTTPEAALHRQLTALGGPLFGGTIPSGVSATGGKWGVDPTLFGKHPKNLGTVDPTSLCVKAPARIEVTVPADLIAGYELVTSAIIHLGSSDQGTAQIAVTTAKPGDIGSLQPGLPILVAESGEARKRMAGGLNAFRDLFPTAVCYSKIVPIDEVVTLTLYHREDSHLARLILTEAERKHLDRLWDELHYVSRDAFAQVDAYKQLMEYATQDGDPRQFEPLRKPTMDAAAALKQRLIDTESRHLDAVLAFADRAYRRPLKQSERDELTDLYRKLRGQEIPHDDAIRLTLARVLVAPAFLYKLEKPGPNATAVSLSDWELANRLSYFLWSSAPDAELRTIAAAGQLREPDVLVAQMKRMLSDDRVRRLAIEFGCQWLHVRGFEAMNEKSERHFPKFAGLRAAMNEETVLFFTDLFQADRTVNSILDSDATFLNEPLAKHYGIPGVSGDHWRRVEGIHKYGRGGILGLSTTLATQSGASRTSPILRGNWVSEVLLGEKLPRPPKGVPQLPDDEATTEGLTVRQLVEKHSSDPKCAVCHKRIDAYGFSLEAFDPIGGKRDKDLAGRPIDTRAKTMDGTEFDGLDGLRNYLLTKRKDAFERQFCKKLLGYALGRSVQLSDEPLLDDIQLSLNQRGRKVSAVLETIVRSKQFREIRGSKYPTDE